MGTGVASPAEAPKRCVFFYKFCAQACLPVGKAHPPQAENNKIQTIYREKSSID